MSFKFLGGILLIVGTTIGAGMLALPIATAELGFIGSVILLVSCWFVMTAGALYLLEVNLWLPPTSNLISMARATIGPYGQILSWVMNLLLLYSLLCAYIAGGSDLFHNLLALNNIDLPRFEASILFTILVSFIVYLGIHWVDYSNRVLMFLKFTAYFLLVILLTPYVSLEHLSQGNVTKVTSVAAMMVTITAFGFSPIVPSLRVYFASDVAKLKKAVLIGSVIPLICYIIWDAAIMGVIPLEKLVSVISSNNSTSDFVNILSHINSQEKISFFAKLFTSICVLTSFLAVGICLSDFWADGLQIEKIGMKRLIIHVLTFLPPLIVVLFFPNAFIMALQYAGVICVALLVVIPAWMVWQGRYHKQIAEKFMVPGGKPLLAGLIIFSLILIIYGFLG